MKRVFEVDVLECGKCGGAMTVIGAIEDAVTARKILESMGLPAEELVLEPARGPPEEWEEGDERPPELADDWM